MERNSFIQSDTEFAGYKVVDKLSKHHDGVREVYEALNDEGTKVVLTVFDVESQFYSNDANQHTLPEDSIEEIRFYKAHSSICRSLYAKGIAEYCDSGIYSYNGRNYAWVTQEFVYGECLDELIRHKKIFSELEALEIIKRLASVVETTALFTNGGGHYNISTDNILVRFEEGKLADVRLIGFSNIGGPCNGKTHLDIDSLDKRFQGSETLKGIFNHRTDVYSLGMVVLLMLAGYPRAIQSKDCKISSRAVNADSTDITPEDFNKSVWKRANRQLSSSFRSILGKATEYYPANRFASIGRFKDFLRLLENRLRREICVSKEEAAPLRKLGGNNTVQRTVPSNAETWKVDLSPNDELNALDEVAGMSELKALFRRDFIRIVRNPKVAEAYGIKPSNCTLLYGPQGCGKTFITEKAAQESGLKYKIVNPSELGSIYVHGSQQKIAELFEEAEKNGPMILIFDEFDAIVPKRDSELNGNQANEVNEMLTQLNNCASRGIYVLATTNRPGLLDPAIMRKGRIDRTVYVSLPDKEARAELFRLEIEKRPSVDMDYEILASATDNYTCSDISFIVEETARLCFEETLDRGLEEPLPLSMTRLMNVIKKTRPSVTETQRKEYLDLKAKMEDRQPANDRKRVGFLL